MQFKIGDSVVHPVYGVGHIAQIEQKRFADKKASRLYYKVTLPRRTVWTPVEIQATTGLRLVTAKDDLDQYRQILKSPPALLTKNHHRRHLELVNRLKDGSFQVVCEVVRDLTAWGQRKPLGPTDKATLQKTKEWLCEEWATSAGISVAEAAKEIDSLLETTQPAAVE